LPKNAAQTDELRQQRRHLLPGDHLAGSTRTEVTAAEGDLFILVQHGVPVLLRTKQRRGKQQDGQQDEPEKTQHPLKYIKLTIFGSDV
jgi:hypothetical protein